MSATATPSAKRRQRAAAVAAAKATITTPTSTPITTTSAKRTKREQSDGKLIVFVGSCAFGGPAPRSVMRLHLSESGLLSHSGTLSMPTENPGWLEWRPSTGRMYCGFENDPGSVQAFAVKEASDPSQPELEALGEAVSSVGRHPCHVALDMTERWLFAANYTEGSVAVLPIRADGSVGPATDSKMHQGGHSIPKELHDRQERPHCHQALVHSSNMWVLVPDLGLSAVFVYSFDAQTGALLGAADDPRHLRLSPGAGCRHAAWNAAGDVLFVNNELDCTVSVCTFDAESGALSELHRVPTLPPSVAGLRTHHRGNSDIHVHPNGRFLFVGVRSSDPGLIAVFAIDASTKALSLLRHESTRGLVPRNFKLCGDGKWLVVGNQETCSVVSFAVDPETGRLTFASELDTGTFKPCNICVEAS